MSRRRWPKGTWMELISAETLRALIKQRGLSYMTLGRWAGCHRSMISHLCAGRSKSCKPDLAQRIAEALGVPLELLFLPHQSSDTGLNDRRDRTAPVGSASMITIGGALVIALEALLLVSLLGIGAR